MLPSITCPRDWGLYPPPVQRKRRRRRVPVAMRNVTYVPVLPSYSLCTPHFPSIILSPLLCFLYLTLFPRYPCFSHHFGVPLLEVFCTRISPPPTFPLHALLNENMEYTSKGTTPQWSRERSSKDTTLSHHISRRLLTYLTLIKRKERKKKWRGE